MARFRVLWALLLLGAPALSQREGGRLAALAGGALRRARAELARADRFEGEALRLRQGSPRWFRLVEGARERLQIAYGALRKYERTPLPPEIGEPLRARLAAVRARLLQVLETLYAAYLRAGARRAAARVLAYLRRVDPARAKALVRGGGKGGAVGPPDRGRERRRGGRVIGGRRGGRLTGAELRWLLRRMQRLGGRTPTPRPAPRPTPRPVPRPGR